MSPVHPLWSRSPRKCSVKENTTLLSAMKPRDALDITICCIIQGLIHYRSTRTRLSGKKRNFVGCIYQFLPLIVVRVERRYTVGTAHFLSIMAGFVSRCDLVVFDPSRRRKKPFGSVVPWNERSFRVVVTLGAFVSRLIPSLSIFRVGMYGLSQLLHVVSVFGACLCFLQTDRQGYLVRCENTSPFSTES